MARAAGVSVETVRYYQRRGLLPRPERPQHAYRRYDEDALARLRFIRRAQELGFTLREAKELLRLRAAGPKRASAARAAAVAKAKDIDEKVRDLLSMRAALTTLVEACTCADGGAVRCPILEALEK